MIKLMPLISLNTSLGYVSPFSSLKEADEDPKNNPGSTAAKPPGGDKPQPQNPPKPPANNKPPENKADDVADNVDREESAPKDSDFKLNSYPGIIFLISKLVTKAKQDNKIDQLAASFVENLKLKDFQAFSEDSKKYSSIDGFYELLNSISSMIDNNKDLNEAKKKRNTDKKKVKKKVSNYNTKK